MQMDEFDQIFYVSRYPDVAASGMDPEKHYWKYGRFEGRLPNARSYCANISLERVFPNINQVIHPNDEMMHFILKNAEVLFPEALYLSTGRTMLEDLLTILKKSDLRLENVDKFLDFASGYGRLTRHYLEHLDNKKVWVSDVQHAGVDFQIDTFGVNGIYSSHSAANVNFPVNFDLIFAISLFTHLPKQKFREWLAKLVKSLAKGGALVISLHNVNLLNKELREDESNFLFFPESESLSLSPTEYGTTYVSQQFLQTEVDLLSDAHLSEFFSSGLCDFHDVAVIRRI